MAAAFTSVSRPERNPASASSTTGGGPSCSYSSTSSSSSSSGIVELVMFLDVCRVYLEPRRRHTSGPCTLWAIVTFLRTEDSAEDFLRWCQRYRVPYLRQRRDYSRHYDGRRGRRSTAANSAEDDEEEDEEEEAEAGFRRLHGFERKLLRALQDLFYCGACLPSDDLSL